MCSCDWCDVLLVVVYIFAYLLVEIRKSRKSVVVHDLRILSNVKILVSTYSQYRHIGRGQCTNITIVNFIKMNWYKSFLRLIYYMFIITMCILFVNFEWNKKRRSNFLEFSTIFSALRLDNFSKKKIFFPKDNELKT